MYYKSLVGGGGVNCLCSLNWIFLKRGLLNVVLLTIFIPTPSFNPPIGREINVTQIGLSMLMLPGLTCELTNKKCICKNVKSPCSTGWTKTTSFRQAPSIMECIAISRPLNTKVPSPNAEARELKALLLQYHLYDTS